MRKLSVLARKFFLLYFLFFLVFFLYGDDFRVPVRTLAILPFDNKTGSDELDYLSEGIVKFFSDHFSAKEIFWEKTPFYISTNYITNYLSRNRKVIFEDFWSNISTNIESTLTTNRAAGFKNYLRKLNVTNITISNTAFQLYGYDSLTNLCISLKADYLLFGDLTSISKRKVRITVKYFSLINPKNSTEIYTNVDKRKIYDTVDGLYNKLALKIAEFKSVLVSFRSEPKLSMVYLDGQYIGRTPLNDYPISIGRHRLSIMHDEYISFQRDIEFTASQLKIFRLTKIINTNVVFIKTYPAKSKVYFDLKYMGRSPIVVSNVSDGIHQILVSKSGFKNKYKNIELNNISTKERLIKKKNNYFIKLTPLKGTSAWKFKQLFKFMTVLTGGSMIATLGVYALYDTARLRYNAIQEPIWLKLVLAGMIADFSLGIVSGALSVATLSILIVKLVKDNMLFSDISHSVSNIKYIAFNRRELYQGLVRFNFLF